MRRMRMALTVLLVGLIHVCGAVRAQDGNAMAEMMKAMQPGPEHAELAKMAGEWELEQKISMGGPPLETRSLAHARMIHGGRFLEMRTSGKMGPMNVEGTLLLGYDNTKKRHFSINLSTMSTGVMYAEGPRREDGAIEYVGTIYEYPTPQGRPFKVVSRTIDDDHHTVDVFDWIGEKWVRVVQQTMRRMTRLFDGRSLAGWDRIPLKAGDDMSDVWSVRDGILVCRGKPAGYIRTKDAYADYELTVEWRWAPGSKGGNSGVLVHVSKENEFYGWPKSLEAQLQAGNAGDFWEIGETILADDESERQKGRRIPRLTEKSPEKPIGEWNVMRVRCEGDTVRVWVNDVLVNQGTKCSARQGKIALQSEGAEIHFRTVRLVKL